MHVFKIRKKRSYKTHHLLKAYTTEYKTTETSERKHNTSKTKPNTSETTGTCQKHEHQESPTHHHFT
jgi:hypothetical protein